MRWTVALLTTSFVASHVEAQTKPTSNSCTEAEYRQFDFWVGRWDVTADGGPAGINEITVEENGCLLRERWVGTRGSTGQSLNFFHRPTRKWRQVWVDSSGNSLDLWGGRDGPNMVLVGKVSSNRGVVLQRITWTKNDDGTLRQRWESSTDEGKTWAISFDGLYRRR